MNSLFSYSITGAEDNAIIESLAETAKANHANPRIYFQYLIDRMMDRNRSARITESFLKELMRQLLEEAEAIRGSEPRKSAYREQELRDMAKRFQKRREQP